MMMIKVIHFLLLLLLLYFQFHPNDVSVSQWRNGNSKLTTRKSRCVARGWNLVWISIYLSLPTSTSSLLLIAATIRHPVACSVLPAKRRRTSPTNAISIPVSPPITPRNEINTRIESHEKEHGINTIVSSYQRVGSTDATTTENKKLSCQHGW